MFIVKHLVLIFVLWISFQSTAYTQAFFSGERLRQAVITYTTKTVGQDAEVLVNQTIADQGFQESNVSAKCTGSKESLRGISNVAIEFSIAGRVVRRVQVPVQVKVYREVAVATVPISYTSTISHQHYTIERRDVTAYSDSELLDEKELTGTAVRRMIPKGSIITRSQVTEIGGIRRGGIATIVVQAGSVVIRTKGTALSDATIGETVRVMREGTNTVLSGILQLNNTVYIGNLGSTLSERE
ncbi:MAG: flagellar basal body P-ring formation protein FlgA [Ignavibacteria bacterium]|nr:flagellar basal body P-ring formation protein FlgA [Ignavibacteria bacterium]